ncbi:MAG: carotenoid 1,2-hydratase [Colwellia sp.]|nr:carotenoid 1,2-hydratase [Colwellia sp.]
MKTKTLKVCSSYPIFILLGMLFSVLFATGCSDKSAKKSDPLKELADDSGDFKRPSADHIISFPQAHAPHKKYRQEWWYLTANLHTENGQSLASQWTLFRRAVDDKHWYFAHAALADSKSHKSSFRNGREDLGNVTISSRPFNAEIDDWSWQSTSSLLPASLTYGSAVGAITSKGESKTNSQAEQPHWQVNLNLRSKLAVNNQQAFFLQGDNGFSKKHPSLDIASHYYSQPFIEVSGEVFWQGKWQKVTGSAWFDREWGSQMLAKDQQGWDWFSLRLTDNKALMVYRLRSVEQDYIYASIMTKDGKIRTLTTNEVQITVKEKSPSDNTASKSKTSSPYPAAFSLVIVKEGIDLNVQVINEKQIMRFGIEYFEGMVTFSGSHNGEGFLEMTGYSH